MPSCNSCFIKAVKEVDEQICPKCGIVVNDLIFDGRELISGLKIEGQQLSSVLMQSRITKDSSGKLLTYSQRNVAKRLKNWQKRMKQVTTKERNKYVITTELDKITNAFSLSSFFKAEIISIYEMLKEKDLTKGKSISATISAITYIICIKYKLAISFEDILNISALKKRKVSKVYKLYIKEVDTSITLPDSVHFVKKYVYYTGLDIKYTQALLEIVNHILSLTKNVAKVGKGPNAYVSTLVYVICKIKLYPLSYKQYMQTAKITLITLQTKTKLIIESLLQYDDTVLKYITQKELHTLLETTYKVK